MRDNFDAAMTAVFGSEGGYVNHPRDPGGPTKYGVTAATLGAWRKLGRAATAIEVRNLGKDEAVTILRQQYATPIRFDDLPRGLDYAVFDYAVNSGPAQAVKSLQRVLNVGRDGIIGAKTLEAIGQRGTVALIIDYMAERERFMRKLSTWATFGRGWSARLAKVEAGARKMAGDYATKPVAFISTADESAKADSADTALSSTRQGKGIVTSALGAIGTAAGSAKDAITPLVGSGGWIDKVFTILTVVGVVVLIAGIGMSTFAETRWIATGNPV